MRRFLSCFVLLAACEKSDVGKPCATDIADVDRSIQGEQPVPEIVDVERDGVCASFLCLRHGGMDPYCTAECRYVAPKADKSCAKDSDCTDEDYCMDGR